jgi:protein-glutamine gamma-glutamyltransferase
MTEMRRDFLSRYALLWVLLALSAALLPHVGRFPLWLTAAAVLAIGWRFMLHLGRWPAPPAWLKTLLVLGCIAGIYATYGRNFAIENMVALLAAGALLKPLEAQRQRDIYV